MIGGEPIVPQVVRLGAAAVPNARQLLNDAYSTLKNHAMLTGVVAVPIAAYGLLTGKRWARWAGGIGLAVALYQYRQVIALNVQTTAMDLIRLRAEASGTATTSDGILR